MSPLKAYECMQQNMAKYMSDRSVFGESYDLQGFS